MKSMTGYSVYKQEFDQGIFTLEIKSVNHRYLDVNIRMPREFNKFEDEIRRLVSSQIKRGHVNVFINFEKSEKSEYAISPNIPLAQAYLNASDLLKKDLKLQGSVDINTFCNTFREVFSKKDDSVDENVIGKNLKAGFSLLLQDFDKMRIGEGEFLKKTLQDNLKEIHLLIEKIEKIFKDGLLDKIRKHISDKIKDLLKDTKYDEDRILVEAALLAEKVDIEEEIVRFKSHIDAFKAILEHKEPQGKRMDFVTQEMNREVNTIGSKANDISISELVIDTKCVIERIREQVQNIE